jgi:hypothetical protein
MTPARDLAAIAVIDQGNTSLAFGLRETSERALQCAESMNPNPSDYESLSCLTAD